MKGNITPAMLAKAKDEIAYACTIAREDERRCLSVSFTFGGKAEYQVTSNIYADTFTYATLDEAVRHYNDL